MRRTLAALAAALAIVTPSGASDQPPREPLSLPEPVPYCRIPDRYLLTVLNAAADAGVPVCILARTLAEESSWRADPPRRPREDGSVDLGIAQLNSAYLSDFIWFDNGGRPFDPLEPREAIPVAARYLARLHRLFGSWPLAVAAYNAGPGRVGRGEIPERTRAYVARILLP